MAKENSLEIRMEDRQSWGSVALIYAGAMICVPGLMIGGLLMTGLNFRNALIATAVGYGIVVAYAILNGMQGCDIGLPTASVTAGALGEKGSKYVISAFIAVACIGWFGIQCSVCGSAFTSALASAWGIQIPVWISSILWGLIMLATAVWGFSGMKLLNAVAVPALVLACVYSLFVSVRANGMQSVFEYEPPGTISMVTGISWCVAGFALGGILVFDYCRYAKTRKDVVKALMVGVFPVSVILVMIGAILSLLAGTYDIGEVFSNLGFPMLGLLAIVLASWTTNTTNAFSGGLAVSYFFNVGEDRRKLMTAAAGGLGIFLSAIGVLNRLEGFLSLISAFIPPIAGVLIANYWILKKGDKTRFAAVKGFSPAGLISFATGAVTAYITGSVYEILISPINGIVVTMALYLILIRVLPDKSVENQLGAGNSGRVELNIAENTLESVTENSQCQESGGLRGI